MFSPSSQSRGPAGSGWGVCLIGAATALVWLASSSAEAGVRPNRGTTTTRHLNADRNLINSTLVDIDLFPHATASDGWTLSLPIEGELVTIDLHAHTNRAPDYQVLVQQGDGSYVAVTPEPERSLRGEISGIEGSGVAANLESDGLRALIIMPDDTEYWLEPVASSVAGAGRTEYLLYQDEEAGGEAGGCAVAPAPADGGQLDIAGVASDDQGSVAGGLFIAELAADADVEYFLNYGSVAAVESQINGIVNTVNLQYERDVNIRHIITTIIVRTAEPDPYTTNVAQTLLNQFRNQWLVSHSTVRRDLAQLFTGKHLVDNEGIPGVIGIAWLGEPAAITVCGSYGFSLVESDCNSCGTFAYKTDLTAHELGHNWGASHCGGRVCLGGSNNGGFCSSSSNCPGGQCLQGCGTPAPGYTMNPTITASNRFRLDSINQITAYRDSRTCLSQGDELRRITVTAAATSVGEGQTLQLTAIADFRYGADEDVTRFVGWVLEPEDTGEMLLDTGVFRAFYIDSAICQRVTGYFYYEPQGVTRSDDVEFVIINTDAPLAIQTADPPNGAIDARWPSDPDASIGYGWDTVEITLNGDICNAVPSDFSVSEAGGGPEIPVVATVEQLSLSRYRLTLNQPVEPGTWTTITHNFSGSATVLGFLPGDVDGDGLSSAQDVNALVEALTGQATLLPHATDIDRSGETTAADIAALVDVLNGANNFIEWNGVTLPE